MKTMQYVKTASLCVLGALALGCGQFREKDYETSLGIVTQLPGNQIDGSHTTPIPVTPTPPVVPPDTELDCTGVNTVTITTNQYNAFEVYMDFVNTTTNAPFAPQVTDSVKAKANETGTYEFYVLPWGSGANEKNESFYMTLVDDQNHVTYSDVKNCSNHFMVEDADNVTLPPSNKKTYVGTFQMEAGKTYDLTATHYCQYFRDHKDDAGFYSSQCASFHYGYGESGWPDFWTMGAANSGCLICDSNSVVLNPAGICVRKVVEP